MVKIKEKLPNKNISSKKNIIKKKKSIVPQKKIVQGVQEKHVTLKKIETPPNNKVKKKTKYVLPSKYITEKIIDSCLSALDKIAIQYREKNKKIFDDDTPIFAEINCIKIPSNKGRITL